MMKEKEMKRVPKLRFPEFTDDWEQRKLSEIADKVTEKNVGLQYVETFTNSAEFGIISQRDFFDHDIAKLGSLDGYYIVKNEDFVYNPRISSSAPVGPINRNKLGRAGVMSPLYTVFRPHDIDTTYLEYFFKCGYWHSFMNFNGDSGARSDRFSIKDNVFFQMPIPIPHIDEQRKIGELLTHLDHLITLHQRKLKNLNVLKKCVMQKLFSQKVRFKADDGSEFPKWKEKRLGDVFTERTERSKGGETLLSVTIAQGIVRQSETDKRNTASENKSNYKIVKRNDLAYNTMRMWQGAEGVSEYDGIVSPAYTVITALDGNNSYFFEILFKQTFMLQIFQRYSQGLTSDTWNLKFPTFSEIKCLVPCEDEQNKIVECVTVLDSVIEKQKATLAAWEELKKGLLQQMFV